MEALTPAPRGVQGPPPREIESYLHFLGHAANLDKISAALLEAALTHEGIIAPLRGAAEEHPDYCMMSTVYVLEAAWRHFVDECRTPEASPEALAAVQSTMLAALRQVTVLIHLREAAPADQQRVVRRARKEGFLRVRAHLNRTNCNNIGCHRAPMYKVGLQSYL